MKKVFFLVLFSGLFMIPKVASPGTYDGIRAQINELLMKEEAVDSTPPATPETTPFDTAGPTFTNATVSNFTATSVGDFVCKDGQITLVPGIHHLVRLGESADFPVGGPVKATIGGHTVLFLEYDPGGFNATLSILNASKLTGRTITVRTSPVPGCADTYLAKDLTWN